MTMHFPFRIISVLDKLKHSFLAKQFHYQDYKLKKKSTMEKIIQFIDNLLFHN